MAVQKWEYCAVYVTEYREGSGGPPRELLEVRMPGAHRTVATHAFGSLGLLNQLGGEGWELVDAEAGAFYLKRPARAGKRAAL